MTTCFAFGCNHRQNVNECSFFRFPKDRELFKTWRHLCRGPEEGPYYKPNRRRKDTDPKPSSRLCSCHFVDGLKSNGPMLLKRPTTYFSACSPEKRRRKVGRKTAEEERTAEAEEERTAEAVEERTAEAEEERTAEAEEGRNQVDLVEEERTLVDVVEMSTAGSSRQGTDVADEEPVQLRAELPTIEYLLAHVSSLEEQVSALKAENDLLKSSKANTVGNRLTFEGVICNFEAFHYYTGLRSIEMFNTLMKWLSSQQFEYIDKWRPQIFLEDQLLLTSVKLRINPDYTDLAIRFQLSRRSIRNIFITILLALHRYMFPLIQMPSIEVNQEVLPPAFTNFSNCRCVVDCTEIQCVVPRSSLVKQSQTYSHYKGRNTFKGLVACAPNGTITFMSKLYPGSASDKLIFQNCGIIELFRSGDMILADKGFLVADLLPPGVTLNIPPFLKGSQLTESEAKVTTEIARARIVIERVIGRMKTFNILDSFPTNLREYADVIFQVVGCLVNFSDVTSNPEPETEEDDH